MTIMPEKAPEPAELADIVFWLRQRIEQLEEQHQEQDKRLRIVEHRTYRIGVKLK